MTFSYRCLINTAFKLRDEAVFFQVTRPHPLTVAAVLKTEAARTVVDIPSIYIDIIYTAVYILLLFS